jgi:hypothetical protein
MPEQQERTPAKAGIPAMKGTPAQQERQQARNTSNSRNASNNSIIPVTTEIPKNAVGTTFKAAASEICE